MALRERVPVGAMSVEVRELTVAEVRDWLLAREVGAPVDPVYALALDDCSLEDIAAMCSTPAEQLAGAAPSDLEGLVAACRRINPHFFRVRAVLNSAALLNLSALQPPQSNATAPHS